jgi:hypothetical protein
MGDYVLSEIEAESSEFYVITGGLNVTGKLGF